MNETPLKQALRLIPYGLFVVGVNSEEEANAFTGSWMTQISFRPPMIVIGVNHKNRSHEIIQNCGAFSINFLGDEQKEVAKHFFQSHRRVGNRLGQYEYTEGLHGCPLLEVALAYLQCEVRSITEVGDHALVVGEVLDAKICREGGPLELKATGWHYGG